MKLKEFIEDVYKTFKLSPETDIISEDKLKFLLPMLRQVDGFSGCILNLWDGFDHLQERKWRDSDDNIAGKFEIHSIRLSPMVYSFSEPLNYRVKNDAGISPYLYDPKTCAPYKEIRMRIAAAEFSVNEELKYHYIKLLNDILDNPSEYSIKGERFVLIRGNFKDVIYLK